MKKRLVVCSNCGEPFTIPAEPRFNAVKYCCKACKKEAKKEQDRKAWNKYHLRWKDHIIHGKRYLGNSNLKTTPYSSFEREKKAIQKEISRLNIKNRERWNK